MNPVAAVLPLAVEPPQRVREPGTKCRLCDRLVYPGHRRGAAPPWCPDHLAQSEAWERVQAGLGEIEAGARRARRGFRVEGCLALAREVLGVAEELPWTHRVARLVGIPSAAALRVLEAHGVRVARNERGALRHDQDDAVRALVRLAAAS